MTILQAAGQVARSTAIQRNAQAFLSWGLACAVTGDPTEAKQYFLDRFRYELDPDFLSDWKRKAAVAPATTTDSIWAAPLVQPLATAFVQYLRGRTVIGALEASARRVPFNTRFARATSGTSAYWVGEAKPIKVSRMDFDAFGQFTPTKLATIVPFTEEIAKSSDPSIEQVLRDDITDAIRAAIDLSLLDPSLAEVAGVRPASITSGAASVPSSGATLSALLADMAALFGLVQTNLVAPYIITTPTVAVKIAALTSGAGSPTIGASGGSFWGVPVIASSTCPAGLIILVDAAELLFADSGIEFAAARDATLQLSDSPDDPTTANTVVVSLWTNNLVGLKSTRTIYWKMRRDDAVAYISGIA